MVNDDNRENTPFCLSFFALISTFLNSYEVFAQTMSSILTKQDFSVQINDQPVALGDRCTPDIARKIDVPVEGCFIGEIPFDGTNYKFYQHQKAGSKYTVLISGGIKQKEALTIISSPRLRWLPQIFQRCVEFRWVQQPEN